MSVPAALVLLLGAYLGNPDNSSAANEATFEAAFSGFSSTVGARPALLDSFVDYYQPISSWPSNSAWAASSFAASADANATIPVIALPLASLASGSPTPDAQFQAFASGSEDAVLTDILEAWTDRGFKTLIFRPGWEMNLPGQTYAGNTAASDADWIAAFQHVYGVLHAAAAAAGATVQIVWNPSITNYCQPMATTALYPGNAYVDAIGADIYADIYPYSDTSSPKTYHDWDTGGEDTTVAQFIADPINRVHYWNYPAATKWELDTSGGHNLSLSVLMQFAVAQHKPFVIPETGAGNANTDVTDDAAFPEWLAQQLLAYETAGGSGAASATADTLAIGVSEDAWNGNAEFTVKVDGVSTGSTYTATASHASGDTQAIAITGAWGSGAHVVTVTFINDAYGGSKAKDRNLYVESMTYDGRAGTGAPRTFLSNGSGSFQVPAISTAAATAALSTAPFVNIWDSNGGGQYAFSAASNNKPNEAAAWMRYFGSGR